MKYAIKQYVIEEGVLEHVKENIGKYALGAAGIAAAGAGEFGDELQHTVQSAGHGLSNLGHELAASSHRVVDHYAGVHDNSNNSNNSDSSANSTSSQHDTDNNNDHYSHKENKLIPKVEYNSDGSLKDGEYRSEQGVEKPIFAGLANADTHKVTKIENKEDNDYSITDAGKAAAGLTAGGLAVGGLIGGLKRRRR